MLRAVRSLLELIRFSHTLFALPFALTAAALAWHRRQEGIHWQEVVGILLCMVAIGFLCWLLFTLAVFALPFFVGMTTGMWAFNSGAGWLGAILVGALAAGLTFGVGQLLLGTVRPLWAKFAIALVFVAPAALAGYHATHGIAKHVMPSEGWQIAFSIVGAVAVGIVSFVRIAGMASSDQSGPGHAQA